MHTIVIGSGLLGLTTAYFLNRNGHQVTVIDNNDGPAYESSYANGGLLTPSMSEPWNTPGVIWSILKYIGKENSPLLFRLREIPSILPWGLKFLKHSNKKNFQSAIEVNSRIANYTLQIMSELRDEISMESYNGSSCGTLKIFRSKKSLRNAVTNSNALSKYGVECKILTSEEVVTLEPALSDIEYDLVGGIFYPGDETGDAHKFCKLLAAKAEGNGVKFQYNYKVEKLVEEGGKITNLKSSENSLKADNYVICAGIGSSRLAKTVGLKLPIAPCKGYSLTIPIGEWANPPRIAVVDDDYHAAITPMGGNLRVAGTAEFNGYDKLVNEKRIKNLFSLINTIYPKFTKYVVKNTSEEWAGLRPVPADGKPIVGPTEYPNLFLNTGHFHLGWTMAAGSGKALADLISGKEPEIFLKDCYFPRVQP